MSLLFNLNYNLTRSSKWILKLENSNSNLQLLHFLEVIKVKQINLLGIYWYFLNYKRSVKGLSMAMNYIIDNILSSD
jgi:hypothetical protein